MAWASRINRFWASTGDCPASSGRLYSSLMATLRSSLGSYAEKTTPMPPLPIRLRITKRPDLLAGLQVDMSHTARRQGRCVAVLQSLLGGRPAQLGEQPTARVAARGVTLDLGDLIRREQAVNEFDDGIVVQARGFVRLRRRVI